MTNKELIKIGTTMGLSFNEKTNYLGMLEKNIVVFDGCNGQRFLIDGKWSKDEIYAKIGESLILMGKRTKAMELHNVLSINSDF